MNLSTEVMEEIIAKMISMKKAETQMLLEKKRSVWGESNIIELTKHQLYKNSTTNWKYNYENKLHIRANYHLQFFTWMRNVLMMRFKLVSSLIIFKSLFKN